MNKLAFRKKLITNTYKIEDYDGVKKILDNVYRKGTAEALVEYLIKTDKQLNSISVDEKNKIITDLLVKNGAKDIEVTRTEKSTSFSFLTQPAEAKLKDPVKVILVLKDEQEGTDQTA